ncbi:hypothetical protein KR018_006934 [Drosophila ironensis]|nr:hypothetical protein KR018_006934 [Drosophila ironensis]
MLQIYFTLFILLHVNTMCQGEPLKSPNESYDYALSQVHMIPLINLKRISVENLRTYANVLSKRLKHVQLAVKQSEQLLKLLDRNIDDNLMHRVKMLRHIRKDWPEYLKLLKKPMGSKEIAQSIELLDQQPTSTDFVETLSAIYKLQIVYNLKPSEMVKGTLRGKKYNVKDWSVDECLMLGLFNQYQRKYDKSEHWFRLALNYFKSYPRPKELALKLFKLDHILELLAQANKELGRYSEAKKYAKELLSLQPNHTYIRNLLLKLDDFEKIPPPLPEVANDYEHQKDICSREYSKFTSKTELSMSWKANLRSVPEFLSETEVETLKFVAKSRLKRDENLSWNCSCKIAELSGQALNIVRVVNQRIAEFTGLEWNGDDGFKVVNYGISGNYNPDETEGSTNDHKANLSDVEQGGEIVFPALNTKFQPEEGTMLFWLSSGKSVLHHQCPLLAGNMWCKCWRYCK